MKSGLSRDELAQICAILETVPSLDKAVLFGSRAMGLARSNSDVDIMLYGDGIKMQDVMQVSSLLEETALPYHFDLIRNDVKNPDLLEHVKQYGKVIFQRGKTQMLYSLCKGIGSYGIAASAVDYSPNLPTYLRISDIKDDGTLNREELKSVDDPNAYKYYLSPNDIVFARTGASTGRNYFYDGSDGEFVYAGFLIKYSLDPEKINPKYIKYYCQSKYYYDWVASFNTGSTRGNINAQTLGNMPIPVLSKSQQDLIADTLSSLDAKIANNTKINHHLEHMAQAIFKSWFVDFEPWGGEMPTDWRNSTIGAVCDVKGGKRLPKGENLTTIPNKHPYIRVRDMNDTLFLQMTSSIEYVPDDIQARISRYIVSANDVIISIVGTIGLICLVHTSLDKANLTENCVKLTNCYLVTHTWLYLFLSSDGGQEQVRNVTVGAVQPKLPIKNIQSISFELPPHDVMREFDDIVSGLIETIASNCAENSRLAALRDTLLPKLMSGELSVVDLGYTK